MEGKLIEIPILFGWIALSDSNPHSERAQRGEDRETATEPDPAESPAMAKLIEEAIVHIPDGYIR